MYFLRLLTGVSSALAAGLLEQVDVWVSVDAKSAPVGAEKVEG